MVHSGDYQKSVAEDVQEVTRNSVEVAFVDEGYSGEQPRATTKPSGIELIVVELPEAQKGIDALAQSSFLGPCHSHVAGLVECVTSSKDKHRPA